MARRPAWLACYSDFAHRLPCTGCGIARRRVAGALPHRAAPSPAYRPHWRLLAPSMCQVVAKGEDIVIVGPPKAPHLPGLRDEGIDERRLVWIQAATPAERLWVGDLALIADDVRPLEETSFSLLPETLPDGDPQLPLRKSADIAKRSVGQRFPSPAAPASPGPPRRPRVAARPLPPRCPP